MAHVSKFTDRSVSVHLRHISRQIENPSNKNIDPERTPLNYCPLSDDTSTAFDGAAAYHEAFSIYTDRKSELHYYNRNDVKTLVGWVLTAPENMTESTELHDFFRLSSEYMCTRYGRENVVAAVVHMDEATPHLHFYFIPVVPDSKHGGEKICCCEVLNRTELRTFHDDLQKYLDSHGCAAQVKNGAVAAADGIDFTVSQLKAGLRDAYLEQKELQHDRWHASEKSIEREEEIHW